MRAAAGLLLPVWALAAAAGAADEAEEELRRTLLESDDPVLIAQREYFPPEHYEMVVRLLARIRDGDKLDAAKARETLGGYSARNWNLYTKRVRRAAPADWRRLLVMRRDLFELIDRTHGPYLCLRYERGGAQALIDADRDRYHGPVGAYISTFIETAARAGPEPPGEELEAGMADERAVPGRAGAQRRPAPAGGAAAGAAAALALLRGDGAGADDGAGDGGAARAAAVAVSGDAASGAVKSSARLREFSERIQREPSDSKRCLISLNTWNT